MNHRIPLLTVFVWLFLIVASALGAGKPVEAGGRLEAVSPAGEMLGTCPLKHTAVDAEISGFIAQVTVTQRFHNPYPDKIEAVYVFPMHQDSAVDAMTMTVGDRVVKGVIKERDEARRIYTAAKADGKVASLLDQERPNIFTQAVANIEPGAEVVVSIRYSQAIVLKDGRCEFDFPTVVGPRYIPDSPVNPADARPMPSLFPDPPSRRGAGGEAPVEEGKVLPSGGRVPDAARITPPVALEGFRAGHDLSVTVRIHAGLTISDIQSPLHEITVEQGDGDDTRAIVRLKEGATLPDRDFVLSYRTAGEQITDTLITHTDERGRFFTLVLQAPARVEVDQVVPRELIFVLDTSGSMSGFPLETSKALMRRAIGSLRPEDRFNLITFAGETTQMASKPLDNTEKNRHRALRFIDTLDGGGGTEMMKAIDHALGADIDPDKVRIVCFLTDGYVGNDMEIIDAVKRHAGTTRVFSFGIGTSVNRFLLDAMARAGRGDVQYVMTHESAEKCASRFYERIDAPVLTDVGVDFGDLAVEEVFPEQVEDLFAQRPVLIRGRYVAAGDGVVRLSGRTAAGRWERDVNVHLPENSPDNAVLASQWARAKVDHLMMQDRARMQNLSLDAVRKEEITRLGITYELLTPFTSFVAVEEQQRTEGGEPRTIQVPLEMPKGVSHSGIFGHAAAPSCSTARVIGANAVSPGAVPVPQNGTSIPGGEFGDGDDFGGGWGEGGGNGGGGGFGAIPMMMSRRFTEADRLASLTANGGTIEGEAAVVKVLEWLKQRQKEDGGWCDKHRSAATGLALLVQLGHGETMLSETHGESMLKAVVFLIGRSKANGGVLADDMSHPRWLHEHAIATAALAEACTIHRTLMIQVPGLEDAVRQAGQLLVERALPTGGWEYPGGGKSGTADTLLTCINLQALRACKHSGLDFRYLNRCVKNALTAIKDRKDAPGALAQAYQQWAQASEPAALVACERIARKEAFRWGNAVADLGTLYFDTHAVFHAGGEAWPIYNSALLPELLAAQAADGSFTRPLVGEGLDSIPAEGASLIIRETQTHFQTCVVGLTLEVYYRFFPAR